jgi:molecular chaperone DnaK
MEPTIVEARSPAVGADGTVAEPVGIETLGGVFTPLLEVGCPVPCEKKEMFSTASDNQDQVTIALYRGRASVVRDATFLGRFQITGIPPMKRGEPQIEVTLAARGSDLVMEAIELPSSRPYKIVRVKD